MKNIMKKHAYIYIVIFIVYVMAMLGITLLIRESTSKVSIQTEWFLGYKIDDPRILYGDNLCNILLYIPIGYLIGKIAPKYKLLTAVMVGLFLSETIECSQLIWHRGTFDVDDLFNNTVGAFFGGVIVVLILWIGKNRNKE